MSKIKNDLRSSVAFTCVSESTPTRKCKSSPGEHCCTFDATAPNKFIYIDPERPLEDTPTGTDAAFSCKAETCSCCQHSHSTAEEPPTAEEQDGDPCGSNYCESTPDGILCAFSSTFRPKTINCLDGTCCFGSLPVYRRRDCDRPSFSLSSLVAGGGDAFYVSEDDYADVAIIDSGANRHNFGDHSRIINRRRANLLTSTADGSQIHITEQGDISLESTDESGTRIDPLVLRDVSIIKGSPFNLMSVGVLCEAGSTFHFSKGNSYFIYKGRKIPLIERNGLYLIRLNDAIKQEELDEVQSWERYLGNSCETVARSKSGKTYACAATYDLWHERFGFSSTKRLKFLFDNGKFKHDAKCTCPTCLQINNARVHIGEVRKFADQVTQRGQLIYSDLCGPFPTSVDGYRYVISFTDAYSRFSACYMLRNKSDSEAALEALVAFYTRHGAIIREIRSDQGGEFGGHHQSQSVSGEGGTLHDKDSVNFFFKRVCDKHNILHVPMPANKPELHGLAERWNRTVFKMANSMLFASRLSHILWPSAVAHANLLRNRLPLSGLGPYTPYELFFHKRPRVDNLRVFGCDAYKLLSIYPKIPGQLARKRLIYVGETADRIGFRCFDPVTYKFSTEFELIFDEGSARKRINSLWEYDARRGTKTP